MKIRKIINLRLTQWREVAARAALAGCIVALLAGFSPTPLRAAQVWLAGVPPIVGRVMKPGENLDYMGYMDLFRPDAPWLHAASHLQVFKTTSNFLLNASDDQLRQMFEGLNQRHIALGVEVGPLSGHNGCGFHVEGYNAPKVMELLGLRVKRLGGELSYVAMDEPLWFGHHYSGLHACHSSITDIAKDVANKVVAIRHSFPNVQVGDIEPFASASQPPDWLGEITQWTAAFRAATGKNLAFFDVDVDWHQNWRPQFASLAPMLRAAGIKFGIIYDGDQGDADGVAWTNDAEERFAAVEADPALVPDQAILQTWMSQPSHMLPESQRGTMTWLINRYAAAQVRITLQQVGDRLEGQLTGSDGKPLPGQRLQVTALDTRNAGPPTDRMLSGIVPAGAATALFAIHFDKDCHCSGPMNVTVGPLSFRDDRTGAEVTRSFAAPVGARAAFGARLFARPGEAFWHTTVSWRVTPGDKWLMQIKMGAPLNAINAGYATLIFLRPDQHEVVRIFMPLEPPARPLGQVTTDATGHFALLPDPSVLRLNPGFRVEYAGNESYRLSSAVLP